MKKYIFFITSFALSAVSLLHAYPNTIYIKNSSDSDMYFIAEWGSKQPKTTADFWGGREHTITVVSNQTGVIEETNEGPWILITARLVHDPELEESMRKGITGRRPRIYGSYSFAPDYADPIYLIYSNAEFKVVTEKEWNLAPKLKKK